LFAGAFALVVITTAVTASSASTTAKPATPAKSPSTAYHASSTAPAHASTHASTAPAQDEHLAAIRQNIEQSRHNLRGYHWKETIVVNYQGEDKSTLVNSCVYDATGKVVRTPAPVPAMAGKGGMRGATPDAKQAELRSYEHSAIALMRSYIPPDPAKLQKSKAAGKMTTETIQDGQRVRLTFKDYEKPGDQMNIEINPGTNQIIGIAVDSFLASAKDAVNLNVDMASLPDGTSYPAKVKLDTPAKQMGLTVTNGDYQKKTS
jgi:hypothetical protein